MADDYRRGRAEPPRENGDDMRYGPPSDGDDRKRPAPGGGPDGGALPSMSYPPTAPPYPSDPRYQERGLPPDPRYQSDPRSWPPEPPASNGYASQPEGRYHPQFPPQDPRQFEDRRPLEDRRPFDDRRPYDDRRQYDDRDRDRDRRQYDDRRGYDDSRPYDDQRPPYSDRRGYGDPYYDGQQGPPGRGSGGGGGGGYGSDYYRYGPYPYGMGPPPPPASAAQQSAPRQRTSIACRYCRKRKIRCSGYTHTTNGKCTNCDKLRIDCIFQPVSSNSSAAFVPVSAVPGGVPPGTPLYGAYGQPLPPAAGPPPQNRSYQYPPNEYTPPMHSPTGSYSAYDDKDGGRRRARPQDEEHSARPPPPNYPLDDDPRRRSPVSIHSNGTPPAGYHPFQQSPYDRDRPPTPNQNSPGRPMPPQQQQQQQLRPVQASSSQMQQQPQRQSAAESKAQAQSQPPSAGGYANPMSLDNMMGPGPRAVNDIDRNMLGRLNRRS